MVHRNRRMLAWLYAAASSPALLAMALSTFAVTARAQEAKPLPARSFLQLFQQVRAGDQLIVTGRDGREVAGRLETASGTHLVLKVRGSLREFGEADVSLVQRRESDSLLNGALIGAAAGGLPIAAFLLSVADCREGGCPAVILIWTGIGAGIGTAIDAAVRGKRTIFLTPTGDASPRVSLAPIVSRDRKGVAISVRF